MPHQFLDREGSWYDYFGRQLVNAETELSAAKETAEVLYMTAFVAYKDEGSSDKKAEAQARIEGGVQEARRSQLLAEQNVKLLKQHLKSFDQAHTNSISLGYMLRKEMDKLSPRVYGDPVTPNNDYEDRLAAIMKKTKPEA